MTTASHNPKEYGGFKLFQHNGAPISGRSGIKTIWRIIETMQDFNIAHHALHNEHFKSADYKEAYADFLFKNVGRLGRPCSVVVDAGNGTTGPVIETVARKLGLGLIPLFFEYDGTFPNRPPNPLEPMALSPLTDKVRKMHGDFGIALDGDGDRVVFVDFAGNVIESEKIFALLAKEALSRSPGRHVIIPINTSKMVSDTVARYGGQGILSPVGWTVITETMRAYNALVAGEVSGHYYFNEFFGGNSGILAALKVIKIFAQSRGQFSSLFSEFEGYCKSEEINIAVDHWPALASRLERVYAAARTMHRIDGLTFEFNNWWFNIRPSNTEPLVRLVVEAKNKEILEEKIAELRKHIHV